MGKRYRPLGFRRKGPQHFHEVELPRKSHDAAERAERRRLAEQRREREEAREQARIAEHTRAN